MAAAVPDEQEAKRQKVEEGGGEKEELEKDAPKDSRAKLKEAIKFQLRDSTLNVIPMHGGRVLAPLSDGGLQYLIAGARANVGMKKGRYCFDVKIVELMSPSEPAQGHRSSAPLPRQLLRVGVATQDSSLFLGETEDSVCFDSEGFFVASSKREAAKSERIARDQVVSFVLNLDPSSPNKNTVSLFKDGRRCAEPQPLPERLIGKTLFPVVNFKNLTLQVHFGPSPMVPLPFNCRGMQDMAKDDADVGPADVPPKGGKYEVVLPIGIPDEGTFDWLDTFLAKHPEYTELSDRSIIKWAEQSGLKQSGGTSWKHSNDKPDVKFGIPMMDDFSVRRVLNSVVATQPRNYVVMEVKANLVPSERAELLKRFNFPWYKKVAQINVGDPDKDFASKVQEHLLKEKQEQADRDWNKRKAEKEHQKLLKAQEAKKQAEAKTEDAEMKETAATDGDTKKEEVKEEEKVVKEEVKEEEKVEDEPDEPKPVATLTEEEKAIRFRKLAVPDLTSWILGTQFVKFSLPEAAEGFDDVRFSWFPASKSEDYFKAWTAKQKVVQRMEELQPGEFFKTKLPEWQRTIAEWQQKQNDWKDPIKEAARKAAKQAAEEAKKQEEDKKAGGEPAPEGAEGAAAGDKPAEEAGAAGASEGADAASAKAPEEKPKAKLETSEDIFAVQDVSDIGDGEPLFAKFTFEDWALLSLRFELYVLARSYSKDANDPERIGIHESNLSFYYNKYFRKNLSLRYYGLETNQQLIDLVKDAVSFSKDEVLVTEHTDETPFDLLLKHTEERRRTRQQSLDAGDETVRLKFNTTPEAPPPASGHQDYGSYRGSWGGGYGNRGSAPQGGQSGGQWYGGGQRGGPYSGGGGYGGKGAVVGAGGGGGGGGGQSRTPCRHWMAGNCQYGARCRFSHG